MAWAELFARRETFVVPMTTLEDLFDLFSGELARHIGEVLADDPDFPTPPLPKTPGIGPDQA